MKHKIRFTIPVLIGATLIVGFLTLILGLLFKLLIGCTVLCIAGVLIAAKIRNRKSQKMFYEHKSDISPDPRADTFTTVRPRTVEVQQSNLAIIPIH